MSRTKNSIRNISVAFISNIIIVIVGFLAQKVFLNVLGEQYNGINGLFSNLISMLSVVELGLGSAIIYNLYKPIAENDIEHIKSLMYFYKKSYQKISLIVFILGLCITPFLPIIIGDVSIKENIYIIYFLFLFDTCLSYLLVYKQSILNGYQKNYIINIVYLMYIIFFNVANIIVLFNTGSYYLYLITKIIFRFLQNFIIKLIADKYYPFINEKASKLDDNIKKDIVTKIKALLVHKIGSIAIIGSDNVIISILIGISSVGYYQNYKMIISQIQNLFTQVFSSLTSSVGNLITQKDLNKNKSVYQKLSFANFWLSTFCSIALYLCLSPFISLWIGEKWLMEESVVLALVINFFLLTIRSSTGCFKDAAGIYNEDKHVPFIELLVNIIFSIMLSKIWGLTGIFIGTIISNLVIHLYSFPKFVVTKVIGQSYKEYYTNFVKKSIIFFLVLIISYFLKQFIVFNSSLVNLILSMILSFLLPNIILLILFHKKEEFYYFKSLIMEKVQHWI